MKLQQLIDYLEQAKAEGVDSNAEIKYRESHGDERDIDYMVKSSRGDWYNLAKEWF